MRAATFARLQIGAAMLLSMVGIIFGSYGEHANLSALAVSLILTGFYIWLLLREQQGSPGAAPAGLWDRLSAFFADYMLAGGILSGFLTLLPDDWFTRALVLLSGLMTYFILPQYLGCRSPGSVLLGIGIRYDSGKVPSFPMALGRVVYGCIALCLWIVSVPMARSNPEKRMWQDKAFGTRVVQWSD
jgi:RDD family